MRQLNNFYTLFHIANTVMNGIHVKWNHNVENLKEMSIHLT